MGLDWKTIILATGGAAAAGAVLYYVCNQDQTAARKGLVVVKEGDDKDKRLAKPANVDDITKGELEEILLEIITSQELLKGFMKDLTEKLRDSESGSFEESYKLVKAVQPPDPLDKHGLSVTDFDQLVEKHQHDPKVRDAIAKVMGVPDPSSVSSEKVQAITVKTIIQVHFYMLEELEALVATFESLPTKASFDMKTVTITAQAVVGAKIEKKFGFTSEDLESAVLNYHTLLQSDQEFANVNLKIQQAMGNLMGAPFMPS